MPKDVTIGFKARPEFQDLLRAEAKMAGMSVSRYVGLIVANRGATRAAQADANPTSDMSVAWQRLAGNVERFAAAPADPSELNALTAAADRISRHLKDAHMLVAAAAVEQYRAAVQSLADSLMGASLEALLEDYDVPPDDVARLRGRWQRGIDAAYAEAFGDASA